MEAAEIQRRVENALEMHKKTYNCAQCVALATCDLSGLDQDATFRIMEGFGGGMGGFTETCGALSGGIAVVSQASCNGMEACNTKLKTYGYAKKLVEQFQERFGDTTCAALRPEEPEMRMPTCNRYITAMVELTCQILEEVE